MNKKILYKFLLIFTVLACTLLISNTKSFAVDDILDNTVTINNNTYTLPDWFFTKEYRLFFTMNGYYGTSNGGYKYCTVIACSDTPFSINYSNDEHSLVSSSSFLCFREGTSGYQKTQKFDFSSVGSSSTKYKLNYLNYDGNPGIPCTEYYHYDFYSNHDILDNDGNLVFQQPPLEEETPVEEKQEITLAPIVEKVEAEKTLVEVLGILPLIIVVVVSLVGLRKALKMLSALLHRA